ncbi:MAG: hypothetical protein JWO20_391 [Candidatus Angelobacter sp.]|jgi:hypothetical protein|nr:hypothetical protein [Candidatus Angelobacter sp.]
MGRIKKLVSLLIFLVAVYLGWTLVPIYLASYQFQDSLVTLAKFSAAGVVPRTDDQLREDVLKKAKELDVPLTPEAIKINREGPQAEISADYTVVVDLIGGKKLTLQFNPTSRDKAKAAEAAQQQKGGN